MAIALLSLCSITVLALVGVVTDLKNVPLVGRTATMARSSLASDTLGGNSSRGVGSYY